MITNDVLTAKDTPTAAPPRAEDIGGPISLEQAIRWTKSYRENHPNQIRAHFFGKNIIKRILSQEKCEGIRIYYAINAEAKLSSRDRMINRFITFLETLKSEQREAKQLIIAGADENLIDQIPGQSSSDPSTQKSSEDHLHSNQRVEMNQKLLTNDYVLADMSAICPDQCSPASPLE